MKRYHITEGAQTTAGGKVIGATSAITIDGVRAALEGDALYCPACKSAGKIKCVGPRIPETWNGKPVALTDDLCMCGCPSPPKLLPSQTRKFQTPGGPAGTQSSSQGQESPAPAAVRGADGSAASVDGLALRAEVINGAPREAEKTAIDPLLEENEEVVEQFFSLLDEKDEEVVGYSYDLFCDGRLAVCSSAFNRGNTASYSGDASLQLVVWHGRDGATKDD